MTNHSEPGTLDGNQANLYKILLIVPAFGLVANALLFVFLMRHKIGNSTTSFILKLQAVNDGVVSFLSSAIIIAPSFWSTNVPALDYFFCYIWHSQFLYWYCIHFGIYIMLMTVFERFFCVVLPMQYKQRKPRHVYIPLLIIILVSIPHVAPMFVEAGMIDEGGVITCIPSFDYYVSLNANVRYVRRVFSVMWFIFDYTLPVILIVILYSFVIKTLRATKMSREEGRKEASSRFTAATLLGAVIMTIANSWDTMTYLLLVYEVIQLNYLNQATNQIGVFM
ncbi:Galanin receptor type 2, partial [Cichlidogyrus casuarinus]